MSDEMPCLDPAMIIHCTQSAYVRATVTAGLIAVVMSFVYVTPTVAQPSNFRTEYERLLVSYAAFKGYPEKTVPAIEGRLSPDRVNVLKAVVRAGLSDLNPGGPLIALVEAVQGIWGVRSGNKQGKHQFRVSVRLKPGARTTLDKSSFVRSAGGAHVLMPVKTGGDDDPLFKAFDVREDAKTWRQVSDDPPKLQISQLNTDLAAPTIGEIDIDFHTDLFDVICHLRPSNSDPSSRKNAGHLHWSMLNKHYNFPPDLSAACHNLDSHCDSSYRLPYCQP